MPSAVCRQCLAVGVLLGVAASAAQRAQAAEWTIAPTLTSTLDNETNRTLSRDSQPSQSATLAANVQFVRKTESLELRIAPQLRWQRFSSSSYGDVLDRSLIAALDWSLERSKLEVTGAAVVESTLTAELAQTGITNSNTYRRDNQLSAAWSYAQTERTQLILQAGYQNVSYYGTQVAPLLILTGYRYPSASIGEQFSLSERITLTPSAFTDQLLSRTIENDSRESGARLTLGASLSERTRLDVSVGATMRSIAGTNSTGSTEAVTFSHATQSASFSLAYSRGLVPYGSGIFVQQQQLTLSGSYSVSERVSLDASISRTEQQSVLVSPGTTRRTYSGGTAGVNWRAFETCAFRAEIGLNQSESFGEPVKSWKSSVSVVWTPAPQSTSR